MSGPEEIYVLMKSTGVDGAPLVAHTTMQGAAMEMVSYSASEQQQLWVTSIRLVDDRDG
jgi:hypothetical protein